jgi:hypothetical protein
MNSLRTMTIVTSIQLYEILRQKLGTHEAEALVGFVDTKIEEADDRNLKNLATKEDIKNVELKIAEAKTGTIRWVFALFISLMLAIIGLYIRR